MEDPKIVEGLVITGNVGWIIRINLITAGLNLLLFAAVGNPASHLTPEQRRILINFQRIVAEDADDTIDDALAGAPARVQQTLTGVPVEQLKKDAPSTIITAAAAAAATPTVSSRSPAADISLERNLYMSFVWIALLLAGVLSLYGLVVQLPLMLWFTRSTSSASGWRTWWERMHTAYTLSAGFESGARAAVLMQLPVWMACVTTIVLWRLALSPTMRHDSVGAVESPADELSTPPDAASHLPARYDSLARTSSMEARQASRRKQRPLYLLLGGWPRQGWDAARIEAALYRRYPQLSIQKVELIYRGQLVAAERQRRRRYLQAFYEYLASLPSEEIHIPLGLRLWTTSPSAQLEQREVWRQAELARLAQQLAQLDQHDDDDDGRTAGSEHAERFTGWILVAFREPWWFHQCLVDCERHRRQRRLLPRLMSACRRLCASVDDAFQQPLVADSATSGLQLREAIPTRDASSNENVNEAFFRPLHAEAVESLSDVQWSHLGIPAWERWLREVVLNVLFALGLLFLSSPVAILSVLQVLASATTNAPLSSLQAFTAPNASRWCLFWRQSSDHQHGPVGSVVGNPHIRGIDMLSCFKTLCRRFEMHGAIQHVLRASSPWSKQIRRTLIRIDEATGMRTGRSSWPTAFVFSYLPVGLLMLINSAVPWMLRQLAKHESHMTRSAEEASILRKSIAYYLLNTLVLPSLAINTAAEVVLLAYRRAASGKTPQRVLQVVERIFRGDNAFFYTNFLIQLALTGNSLALLHPMHWLRFLWRRQHAYTPLVLGQAGQVAPFDYPYAYAQVIKVLAIGFFLGPFVPFLWLFIGLYLVTKYFTDRYNLSKVHPPHPTDTRMARTATNAGAVVLTTAIVLLVLLSWIYGNTGLLLVLLLSVAYLWGLLLELRWHPDRLVGFTHRIRQRFVLFGTYALQLVRAAPP